MAAIAYSEVARVKRVEPGQHRTHAPQQSSSYLITSSARPSSESGTVGPSTLEWTVIAGTNRALPLPKPLTREPRVSTLDKLSRRLGSIRHNRELIRLTALGDLDLLGPPAFVCAGSLGRTRTRKRQYG